MNVTNTDILIVGGGVIGNSIAYHLARQGHQVLVIDRSNIADSPSASWASAGGVRRQGRHPAEAKLASEAIQRWKTLEKELEADVGYRRGGS
jgi:sarcosine oxidase, subunit beta